MSTEDPIDKLLGRAALDLPAALPPPYFAEQVVRLHQSALRGSHGSRRLRLRLRWFALCLGLGLGFGSAYAAFHGGAVPKWNAAAPDERPGAQTLARDLHLGPSPWGPVAPAEPERAFRTSKEPRASKQAETAQREPDESEKPLPGRAPLLPRCDCGPAAVVCSCY